MVETETENNPKEIASTLQEDEKDEKKEATFENILDLVGGAGRYQLFIFIITSIVGFFTAEQNLGGIFLSLTPDHWCTLPELDDEAVSLNWTESKLKQVAIPLEKDGYSKCKRYVRNLTEIEHQPWNEFEHYGNSSLFGNETEQCASWTFNTSDVISSVVMDWNLVCDRRYLQASIQAVYMAGVFVGSFTQGYLSDRFGRRKVLLESFCIFFASSVLLAFSPYFPILLLLRFLVAFGGTGLFTVGFCLCTELSSANRRDLFGIAFEIPFSFGYMAVAALAYGIRQWSYLQLAYAVPVVILACYFFILPESPRWLITKGRIDEALPILKTMAKWNNAEDVTDSQLLKIMDRCYKKSEELLAKSERKHGETISIFLNLFRTPQMRKQILISCVLWCSVSLGYYGIAFHSPSLTKDPYIVTILSGVVEIPSYVICYFIIRYLGRKPSTSLSFLVGGISCFIVIGIPSHLPGVLMTFVLIGKAGITIAFAILYLYTTEIFPTRNRSLALGSSSMSARLGSIIASYVAGVLGYNYPIAPPIIFGITSVISGLLCLLLPESKGKMMPETPEDVENGLRDAVKSA